MALINFKKITPIRKLEDKTVEINGQEVIIKQYLPINDKATLIENVLNNCISEEGLLNSIRKEIFFGIELIKSYTNISITDALAEKANSTYDSLVIDNILQQVKENIPKEEYSQLCDLLTESIDNILTYNTSAAGIVRQISNDYNASKINIDEMMQELGDSDKVGLVKEVLDKMG